MPEGSFMDDGSRVSALRYDFLVPVKYKRAVFGPEHEGAVRGAIEEVAAELGARVLGVDVGARRLRFQAELGPRVSPNSFAVAARRRVMNAMYSENQGLRSRLPVFWSKSYLVKSLGAGIDEAEERAFLESVKSREGLKDPKVVRG